MKHLFISTVAGILAAVLFIPLTAGAESARSAILTDTISGRALYAKRPEEKSLIASTTKIMTALLICEQCNVLDRMQIPKEAVGVEGSSMYLQEGEVLTLQELLYGLMLSSGNDAATALALYCSGSLEGFAERMNDKARALGLRGTHFANPHGLDAENHYSTAADLAKLAAYAMENPIFQKTVSARTITIGNRSLRNHNKLLWQYPEADGVKTGYTKAAGRILVSSAKRDDRRLVAVTIHDPNDWEDHKQLLEKGFSRFRLKRIVTKGDVVGHRSVVSGTRKTVEVVAKENFSYAVAQGENPQLLLSDNRLVYAPVAEDSDAGFVYVLLSGKAVGKVPVAFGQTVEQMPEEEKRIFFRKKDKP